MDFSSLPFIPRYKRSHIRSEDILDTVYQESISKSRKKIASFLEDESYVMQNILPSIEDTGFKLLPYTLEFDGYIAVSAVKMVYDKGSIDSNDIFLLIMLRFLNAIQLFRLLMEKMSVSLIYAFKSVDESILVRELNKFLMFFCKCYIRYPDYIFGLFDIKNPLLLCTEQDDHFVWTARYPYLNEEQLYDCAKLDEVYFLNNPVELYSADFCTNLIESSQETAGRRLSFYLENRTILQDGIPRKYKLFSSMTKTFKEQYYQFYVRFLLKRYQHWNEESLYTCPYTEKKVMFPPCFVIPENSNPEFSRDSEYHQRFVKPFVPLSVTIDNIILDELFLCSGMSATEAGLFSRLKSHPFIQCDDEHSLMDAMKNILWYHTSMKNPKYSVSLSADTHVYNMSVRI